MDHHGESGEGLQRIVANAALLPMPSSAVDRSSLDTASNGSSEARERGKFIILSGFMVLLHPLSVVAHMSRTMTTLRDAAGAWINGVLLLLATSPWTNFLGQRII